MHTQRALCQNLFQGDSPRTSFWSYQVDRWAWPPPELWASWPTLTSQGGNTQKACLSLKEKLNLQSVFSGSLWFTEPTLFRKLTQLHNASEAAELRTGAAQRQLLAGLPNGSLWLFSERLPVIRFLCPPWCNSQQKPSVRSGWQRAGMWMEAFSAEKLFLFLTHQHALRLFFCCFVCDKQPRDHVIVPSQIRRPAFD